MGRNQSDVAIGRGIPRTPNNGLAVWCMLPVVAGISLAPVLFALGGAGESPFLFNAGWRVGVAGGCLAYLLLLHRRLMCKGQVWNLVLRRMPSWALVLAIIGNCEYLMFAQATRFIDISTVTVIYEIWPVLLILLVQRLYRHERRYRGIGGGGFGLLALSCVGVVMAILAQTGSIRFADAALTDLVLGLALALAAAGLAPLMAFGFRWGSGLADDVANASGFQGGRAALEMFGAVVAFLVSSGGAAVVNAGAGWLVGESIGSNSLAISLAGGALANAVAGIAWRKANFVAGNLSVNGLAYLAPPVSLGLLALCSMTQIARMDYLVIGAVAVVSANLLSNVRWRR